MVINKSVEFVKMITINIIEIMVFITCMLAFLLRIKSSLHYFFIKYFSTIFLISSTNMILIYTRIIFYQLNDYDNTITIIITLITTMMMMMIRFGVYVRR